MKSAPQHQRGHDAPEQQPRAALVRHAEVGEQQQEDEQVVERQRALDQIDGGVEDGVLAARCSASTTSAAARLSTSQPIDQTTASLKSGSRPRAKKWRSSQRKTSRAATSASHGAISSQRHQPGRYPCLARRLPLSAAARRSGRGPRRRRARLVEALGVLLEGLWNRAAGASCPSGSGAAARRAVRGRRPAGWRRPPPSAPRAPAPRSWLVRSEIGRALAGASTFWSPFTSASSTEKRRRAAGDPVHPLRGPPRAPSP